MFQRFDFHALRQSELLSLAAVLVAFLVLNHINLHGLFWMLLSISKRESAQADNARFQAIGDSEGDDTNPAGDPPPPGGNG